jgi:hypothetical protein
VDCHSRVVGIDDVEVELVVIRERLLPGRRELLGVLVQRRSGGEVTLEFRDPVSTDLDEGEFSTFVSRFTISNAELL